jgi:hypothetical protein
MKSVILECVLVLMAFAVLEETALARNYLNCLTKKVAIVDAPKGATSSSGQGGNRECQTGRGIGE